MDGMIGDNRESGDHHSDSALPADELRGCCTSLQVDHAGIPRAAWGAEIGLFETQVVVENKTGGTITKAA
jgi:hypothetical protein